jgi:hypothetical protein
MKIKDKAIGQMVDIYEKDCLSRACYWPRQDPGVFAPGIGYRQRPGKIKWLCGTREIRGCPDDARANAQVTGAPHHETYKE